MNVELLIILIVVLLATIPFQKLLGRVTCIIAVLLAIAAFAALSDRRGETRAAAIESESHRPIEVSDRGFVSSDTCKQCHPGEYATWHASWHRTMTQVANTQSVVGDFDDVELMHGGIAYRLSKSDGRYHVSVQKSPGSLSFDKYEIALTTGSHHMQFYWFARGDSRQLGKLPFVFLFSEQRWVPAESTFLRPPGELAQHGDGQWNHNCVNCHTTGAQPKLTYTNGKQSAADTHVAELGISCEACHGPAEQHVAKHRNAIDRYLTLLGGETDNQIVHPETLDSGRQSQVCGQCHGIGFPKDMQQMAKVLTDGFQFRAGDDMFATESDRILVENDSTSPMVAESMRRDPRYLRAYFWPDGMVRVSGREFNGLVRSPCYQHDDAEKRMQCTSCHQLHPDENLLQSREATAVWADDQLGPNMRDNHACLQCHAEFFANDALAEHTHHAADSVGSECYNCHMPHTTYGLLKGIRSHTVSTPSVAESKDHGRPNACNLCHLDESLQWTATHLQDWYGTESPDLTIDEQNIAASVLWATEADAGTRALVAWHMGWSPAIEAAGKDWIPPYLGLLMSDSYDAVRYIAWHALKEQAAFADFPGELDFDFTAPASSASFESVLSAWNDWDAKAAERPETLIAPNATLDRARLSTLLKRRDNTPILLSE